MSEFILFMHTDTSSEETAADWNAYIERLSQSGHLRGGSAIGKGICHRKHAPAGPLALHISGFLRIEAEDFNAVQKLLEGNPTYEAGGTVEIRELPKSP